MTASAPQLGLETRDLSVTFGGLAAVSNVSLRADTGMITGLIGPNGAGKTTTFNACNGLLTPTGGSVHLFGRDVTRRSPAARASAGLGRTFQRVEICHAVSVRSNVMLGCEARAVGANPIRQIFAGSGERRSIAEAADDALALCDIEDIADTQAATLSTGQQRLLELARVLAGGFRLLLLDEPSSGLDEDETERFCEILRRVVAERGIGILLVEHDMGLVMSACQQIFVLDFGALIFEGTPQMVQTSEIVRTAYLGSEAPELTS